MDRAYMTGGSCHQLMAIVIILHVYVYLFLMQSICSQDIWDILEGFAYKTIGLVLVRLFAWLWREYGATQRCRDYLLL